MVRIGGGGGGGKGVVSYVYSYKWFNYLSVVEKRIATLFISLLDLLNSPSSSEFPQVFVVGGSHEISLNCEFTNIF